MLRLLRIALATLAFAGICLLFLDVGGRMAPMLADLAKWQLVPALLSGSLAVLLALFVLTLALGRVYCSVLCPLGVLQDLISSRGKPYRFGFRPARTRLRLAALGLFAVALTAGLPLVVGVLEPYSAFGRIATELAAPVWATGSNAAAWASARAGNFAVAPTPVWQKGAAALWLAAATLLVVGVMAWRSGRAWCNTLCPVGTFLGFLSRRALIRPRINEHKCTRCGLCAKGCKASCIDEGSGAIDGSRCVSCLNCLDACRQDAISYSPPQKKAAQPHRPGGGPNPMRRALLASALGALAPVAATAATRDRKAPVPALNPKETPDRPTPITPPGSQSVRLFRERCTGCQLCVSACPNQVLRSFDRGDGMLQPTLSFEHGYCRVNCVACSTVCPTGAIRPMSPAEKSATQIGRAVISLEQCVTTTDKVSCTACARNCPPRAINLVGPEDGVKVPVVDPERCNGCGACEYVCPVRPVAAVLVHGNTEHRRI